MTFSEKRLYHQIHPIKLAIDITSSLISLYFFWYHSLLIALIIHFLLPVFGSFLVITSVNLEKQKQSTLGKYIGKYMTNLIVVMRLVGDFLTVFGAWYHVYLLIILGFLVILVAWCSGNFHKKMSIMLM